MREIKTFITSFFYKIGRIKYAIMVVRWNKSSEAYSSSEEIPEWKCMYMNESISKERRWPNEHKTD